LKGVVSEEIITRAARHVPWSRREQLLEVSKSNSNVESSITEGAISQPSSSSSSSSSDTTLTSQTVVPSPQNAPSASSEIRSTSTELTKCCEKSEISQESGKLFLLLNEWCRKSF
jgi:hypothetical protein